jgi:hypothetical protein
VSRADELLHDHELLVVGTAAGVLVAAVTLLNARKAPIVDTSGVQAASAAGAAAALAAVGIGAGAGNLSGSGVIGTGGGSIAGGAGTGDHSASGPAPATPQPVSATGAIAFSAPTTIWSRTNAGYIGARKTAGSTGTAFPVDVVTVPHDPATNTGGVYYRLLDGPNAGWLVSANDPAITRVA